MTLAYNGLICSGKTRPIHCFILSGKHQEYNYRQSHNHCNKNLTIDKLLIICIIEHKNISHHRFFIKNVIKKFGDTEKSSYLCIRLLVLVLLIMWLVWGVPTWVATTSFFYLYTSLGARNRNPYRGFRINGKCTSTENPHQRKIHVDFVNCGRWICKMAADGRGIYIRHTHTCKSHITT